MLEENNTAAQSRQGKAEQNCGRPAAGALWGHEAMPVLDLIATKLQSILLVFLCYLCGVLSASTRESGVVPFDTGDSSTPLVPLPATAGPVGPQTSCIACPFFTELTLEVSAISANTAALAVDFGCRAPAALSGFLLCIATVHSRAHPHYLAHRRHPQIYRCISRPCTPHNGCASRNHYENRAH